MKRLPNTLNVSFDGIAGYNLLAHFPFLAASTGSACHAGKQHKSPVLTAMGLNSERCLGAVRFSLGRSSSKEEIDIVVPALSKRLCL
jgi:cysteine desulfurase